MEKDIKMEIAYKCFLIKMLTMDIDDLIDFEFMSYEEFVENYRKNEE